MSQPTYPWAPGSFEHLQAVGTAAAANTEAIRDVMESKVIPDTVAGSFDEIQRITNTLGVSDGVTWNPVFSFPTSNFEECAEINYLVGNTVDCTHATMLHQKKIIEGEWNEMCEHVESGDLELLRDDIADMLFTIYGLAARLGIPADLDFKKVCASQFTKFDNSVTDALKTRDKYSELGVTTYYTEETRRDGTKIYITYSAIDQTGKDNKPYPAGKWLKSCNFQEPVFDPLP